MTEADSNIRESLLGTLSFLASETKQREFASKVFYASYQDEFACWWFDTFFPDESGEQRIFNEAQLNSLRSFSESFDRQLVELGDHERTIEQLLKEPEWQCVVAGARATLTQFSSAA